MKLAKTFWEFELLEFFETEPILDDTQDEREFFGTRTFQVQNGSSVFLLSLDPYTANVTLELLESEERRLIMTFELSGGRLKKGNGNKSLELTATLGFRVLVSFPSLHVSVFGSAVD